MQMTNFNFVTRLICILFFSSTTVFFNSEVEAQNSFGVIVDITNQFESDFQLIDIGLRADGSFGAVGNGTNASGANVARLIDVSPDRLSFSSSTLVGLGSFTEVFGISSEGSRIAGRSTIPGATDFRAISWLSNAPGTGIDIGANSSSATFSTGLGAWSDGVVGTGVPILLDRGTRYERSSRMA